MRRGTRAIYAVIALGVAAYLFAAIALTTAPATTKHSDEYTDNLSSRVNPNAGYCPRIESFPETNKCGPWFEVVGTMKAGTTSFLQALSRHGEIALPPWKELCVFDYPLPPPLDARDFASSDAISHAIRRLHNDPVTRAQVQERLINVMPAAVNRDQQVRRRVVTGDASPDNLFRFRVPLALKAFLPTMRLIVLLRDPVARAISHWAMVKGTVPQYTSAEEFFQDDAARVTACSEQLEYSAWSACYEKITDSTHRFGWLSPIARGLYHQQLVHLFQFFHRSQVLVLKSEDFYDPHSFSDVMNNVTDFLQLSSFDWRTVTIPHEYSFSHHVQVSNETIAWMRSAFANSNRQLANLLGDHYNWGY